MASGLRLSCFNWLVDVCRCRGIGPDHCFFHDWIPGGESSECKSGEEFENGVRGRILKFENVKMRNQILIVACFVFCFCTNPEQGAEHDRGSDKYVKSDLKKLKWIEGKWKGLSNNQPFYEIY